MLSVLVISGIVIPASQARADDQADARAIVAKAIKAAGGEEALKKHSATRSKESGTYYGMGGDGFPYTGEYAVQWPHQWRMDIAGVFMIGLNGDKGWISANGETRDMSAEELKIQQDAHYFRWIATLLPLKDKKFKLATAGETKLSDRAAVGVRVSAEKHADISLYFDKESGLLVKTEHRAHSEEQSKEVNEETFLSDHKEIDGAQIATKIVIKRDGERYIEAETLELKAVGKLDDGVFAKPQ
jgi:hypothetical protein